MQDVPVNVKCNKGDRAGQAFKGTYSFGSTAEESINAFGADVVNGGFIKSAVIAVQNVLRAAMEAGTNNAGLNKLLGEYKPGVTLRGPRAARDPVASIMAKAESGAMSPEQIQDLIKQLRGALQPK